MKTLREAPKDEEARGAQFLIRAGYVNKEMAGVYNYLPLGLKAIEKIKAVIREEMAGLGAEEIEMTALQNAKTWQASGRWDDKVMDVWFKTKLNAGGEVGLAPTHEEPITKMLTAYVNSYKDLPCSVFQFQTKFRNELRAKSGILRTREFLMKDLYSFAKNREEHEEFYHKVEASYKRIYEKLGLPQVYQCFASGGAFSKYSHEFQCLTPVGEDTIYHNADFSVVLNEEVLNDEVLSELGVKREELVSEKAAEVGNIFTLGEKYSEPLGLKFNDENGERKNVFMGSYGIGVSRVFGVIAEKMADEKGLVLPSAISPYQYYLIGIGDEGMRAAEEIFARAPEKFIFDDRDERPGVKFADAELIGIPERVVVSDKTLRDGKIEVVTRANGATKLLTKEEFLSKLS